MRITTMGDERVGVRIPITGRLVLGPRTSWTDWRPLVDAAAGRVLTLEMSRVSQIDAAGLGLLVTLARAMRKRGGRLRLMCAGARQQALIRTVGLGAALGMISAAAVNRAVRRRDVIGGSGTGHLPEPAACRE
jgi:anti-anti-sigma factor